MGPESFKKPANPLNSRLEEVPELHTDPEVLEHLKSKIAEFSGDKDYSDVALDAAIARFAEMEEKRNGPLTEDMIDSLSTEQENQILGFITAKDQLEGPAPRFNS